MWVFFSGPFGCQIIGISDQHLCLCVLHPQFPCPVIVSFVHARCTSAERHYLWRDLLQDKPCGAVWCIVGDFNVIVYSSEKKGGKPYHPSEGLELLDFMNNVGIFYVEFLGSRFTWCSNRYGRARIWKWLDRMLINIECLDMASSILVSHLVCEPSDNAPLLISFSSRLDNKSRLSRFLNIWTSNDGLRAVIKAAWQVEVTGSPFYIVRVKLCGVARACSSGTRRYLGMSSAT